MTRTRSEAAHEAAGEIYSLVVRALRETSGEEFEGVREHRTKLAIEGRIADATGRSYEEALGLMFAEGVREAEHESLSGVSASDFAEEGDDPEKSLSRLDLLKRACQRTIERVDEQLGHACSYDENDHCTTCGGDGRA